MSLAMMGGQTRQSFISIEAAPASRIELKLGDTKLPEAGPTYGSSSTMGVGAAVLAAAQEVRGQLARLANLPPVEATMVDGRIARGATEGLSITDVMDQAGPITPEKLVA
jgi:CO/xanthine dehydrogenase Mo-binding subunit